MKRTVTTKPTCHPDVPPMANAANPTTRFAGTTVLLVEDDVQLRELLYQVMADWGMVVTAVIRGDRVLAEALRTKPDVILLDLFLPGKDGFEVLRELRRLHTQTQVIAMSGEEYFKNEAFHAMTVLLGAHRFLLKPFAIADLEQALANLPLPPGEPGLAAAPAGAGGPARPEFPLPTP